MTSHSALLMICQRGTFSHGMIDFGAGKGVEKSWNLVNQSLDTSCFVYSNISLLCVWMVGAGKS